MKINRNFIAVLLLTPLFLVSCINDDFETSTEDLTNAEIMNQLKISDVSIWNTLTTQSIDLSTLKSSDLKSAQAIQEWPKGGNYYFALYEDLYPSEGDYDFNDIIIKSILGFEKKGSEITGYVKSELVNKGGSLPVEIALMFYEVSGNKYTRIPNENIEVNGEQLQKGGNPWSIPYEKLGKSWQIDFKFTNKSANIWIAYHIVTVRSEKRIEILTGGFAPTNVTEPFETPQWDFLTKKGLPWGLEIEAKEFAIPNEKVLFLDAYPLFKDWAESGGVKNKKWFEKPDPAYTHN
jgi:hypothetical protein